MNLRKIGINSSIVNDTPADISKKANKSILEELKKRIANNYEEKVKILEIFKHELEFELKKNNEELDFFNKILIEKENLLLKKENLLRKHETSMKTFYRNKYFKFNEKSIILSISVIQLSIIFMTITKLPIALTFSLVAIGAIFELSKYEIEKNINKYFQGKYLKKRENDLKYVTREKEENERLKTLIQSNKNIIEHDLNIKLYLCESIKIIDEELNKIKEVIPENEINTEKKIIDLEITEEKAKIYLKS